MAHSIAPGAGRTPGERSVIEGLRALQRKLHPWHNLTYAVNPGLWFPDQRIRRPDVLVLHRGRAAVIEVDGGSHTWGRYCADRSRDGLFEDSGDLCATRIAEEDACDPDEVEVLLWRLLFRMDPRPHVPTEDGYLPPLRRFLSG